MKLEPCPYCRSVYAEPILFNVSTNCDGSLDRNIKVECVCGLTGPSGPNNLEAISKWNWLSKAVGERDYYREKVIQLEQKERKKC